MLEDAGVTLVIADKTASEQFRFRRMRRPEDGTFWEEELDMKILKTLVMTTALAATMFAAPAMAEERIALVVKSLGNGFFDAAAKGAEEAAKEIGDIEVIYTGPTSATAEGQIEIVNSLIAQNVDAIAISANDPDALVPALKKAMSRGIKVISWDSGVAPEGRMMHLNPSDTDLIGETIIKLAADYLPEGGDVAILSASSTATNQNAWIEAAKEVLPEKFPNINLVATVYGDDDSVKSTNEAKGLIATYPDLKAIIAPTTVGVVAAAQVVTDRGPDRKGKRDGPRPAVGVQAVHRQWRVAGRGAVEPDRSRLFRRLSEP